MIKFVNIDKSEPYKRLYELYKDARNAKQESIEAILISSYSTKKKEVDARYVNLKIVEDNRFIFFSNYNSPKSIQFKEHEQITAVIFWQNINTQIRLKSIIKKLPNSYSDKYFLKRSPEKNALAISSDQSNEISSYSEVKKKYEEVYTKDNLNNRPAYWGGFQFTPYYFEFWKGHASRINKREAYELNNQLWLKKYLEP